MTYLQPIGEVLRNQSYCVEQDKDLELTDLRYDDLPTAYVDHNFQQGRLIEHWTASNVYGRKRTSTRVQGSRPELLSNKSIPLFA